MAETEIDLGIPVAVQETAVTRYRGGELEISSSDRTFWALMERRGWGPGEASHGYRNWKLPGKAFMIRSRSVVEAPPDPARVERMRELQRSRLDVGPTSA